MDYQGYYDYYEEKMLECVKKGQCTPMDLASLRNSYKQRILNEPQEYLFLDFQMIPSLMAKKDFNKIKQFNENNKTIGLPSIEYQRFRYEF